jgi:hypothetical protein
MRDVPNIVLWLIATALLELIFFAVYGLYTYGGGGYLCGADASYSCDIVTFAFNKLLTSNVALFGVPTILAGVLSIFLIQAWRDSLHSFDSRGN